MNLSTVIKENSALFPHNKLASQNEIIPKWETIVTDF
jgi:hypothetical protein